MAFNSLFVAVVVVATAQAGYGYWPGIQLPNAPFLPSFPGFPNMPFAPFPPSAIKVPTPEEIAAIKPPPGTVFSGMAASSTSSVYRDKDGNIVKKGGTTIVSNENGEVQTFLVGNNPPTVGRTTQYPGHPWMPDFDFKVKTLPSLEPLVQNHKNIRSHVPDKDEKFFGMQTSSFSHFSDNNGVKSQHGGSDVVVNNNGKVDADTVRFNQGDKTKDNAQDSQKENNDPFNFKPLKFKPFKPITFKPPKIITPEEIKNKVPGNNENFVGYSTSSFSHSSDINGKKSASGGSDTVVNDNGKVDQDSVRFNQGDKPE